MEQGVCISTEFGNDIRDSLRHETGDEGNIVGEPVEFRDNDRTLVPTIVILLAKLMERGNFDERAMRLSRIGYYRDFVVYPLAITGLMMSMLWHASPEQAAAALGAFAFGLGAWTLVEYLLHRHLLHSVPYLKDMHGSHHGDQTALIGAPTWLSLSLFVCLVYLPLQFIVPPLAGGLTAGFMTGYVWYFVVHHLIHHNLLGQGTYAFRLKRRHMLHHHFDNEGNFGVTTGAWDRFFGTDIQVGTAGGRNRLASRGQSHGR